MNKRNDDILKACAAEFDP